MWLRASKSTLFATVVEVGAAVTVHCLPKVVYILFKIEKEEDSLWEKLAVSNIWPLQLETLSFLSRLGFELFKIPISQVCIIHSGMETLSTENS